MSDRSALWCGSRPHLPQTEGPESRHPQRPSHEFYTRPGRAGPGRADGRPGVTGRATRRHHHIDQILIAFAIFWCLDTPLARYTARRRICSILKTSAHTMHEYACDKRGNG
jgi:hypothetical protein